MDAFTNYRKRESPAIENFRLAFSPDSTDLENKKSISEDDVVIL